MSKGQSTQPGAVNAGWSSNAQSGRAQGYGQNPNGGALLGGAGVAGGTNNQAGPGTPSGTQGPGLYSNLSGIQQATPWNAQPAGQAGQNQGYSYQTIIDTPQYQGAMAQANQNGVQGPGTIDFNAYQQSLGGNQAGNANGTMSNPYVVGQPGGTTGNATGSTSGTLDANGMPNFGATVPIVPWAGQGIQTTAPTAGPIQGSVNPFGNIQTSFAGGGPIQGSVNGGGPIQTSLSTPQNYTSSVNTGGLPSLVSNAHYAAPIVDNLDLSGVSQLVGGNALAGQAHDAQNAAYASAAQYLDPQWQNQQNDLQSSLANQGIVQGSDAYNRAVDEFNRNRTFAYSNAYNNAYQQGLAAQNQLFNQGLQTNQTQFGQALDTATFHNTAQNQGFGQALANAQLANSARGQGFNEGLSNAQLNNAAQTQQFQNSLNAANFGNAAQAQQFGQNLAQGQYGLAAQNQQYNQNLGQANYGLNAQNQGYQQNLANAQYGLAAQGQGYQQQLANMQATNAAQNQGFSQNYSNAQMANSLQNQMAQQWLQNQGYQTSTRNAQIGANASVAAANAASAASTQNVAAQIAANQQQNAFNNSMAYNNMLYNQGMGTGQYYMNLMNGMYGGPGANGGYMQPNFTTTPGANVGNTDVGGIYNMGYNGQMNAYNAQMGNYNSMMGGLFGLGSAGLMGYMMPSDRRLKENIRQIGVHAVGVPVYAFDYVWGEPAIGVMADELERVRPDLVHEVGGFKAVNYGGLQ